MARTTLARWLVVGALAGFGLLVGTEIASAQTPSPSPEATAAATGSGDSTVQGSNTATDSTATSSSAAASNGATVNSGPAATGATGGTSSQIGDNSVRVNQSSNAKSGDAVAGSQVTGVVGGNATVQNVNNSTGATATSGDAVASNTATVNAGPSATATGTGNANAQQIGDNTVRVDQESVAESGDSVAGSQVTGIVGDGDSVVQNTNNSTDATALSGNACAGISLGCTTGGNDATVNAGPFSMATDGTAQAGQVGDNDAVLTQSSIARSGDAVAGSQVTGIVGDGDSTVQGTNTSTDPVAVSGDAIADNVAIVVAGPSSVALNGGLSQASQTGDNSVALDQESESSSGDAVAGSQVTGLVSEERGHLTVQNQQSSDTPTAVSGAADAVNDSVVTAGPDAFSDGGTANANQIGDNDVDQVQTAEAVTGDAVAGGQVTGVVGGGEVVVQNTNDSVDAVAVSADAVAQNFGDTTAGPVADGGVGGSATADQIGDNSVVKDQDALAESGDAVAGGQVTGIVADGDVTVQANNTADTPTAVSGVAVAQNFDPTVAGPSAVVTGTGDATATQNGDNEIDLAQGAEATSGDAVAGGGVFGIVADGEVTLQGTNDSVDAVAVSGDAVAQNFADALTAGPSAVVDDGDATATQIGDNDIVADQASTATSGDAVSGSQVAGVVNDGGETTIQLNNTSDSSTAVSGAAVAQNFVTGLQAGPLASSTGVGTATATQTGDNAVDLTQDASSTTGDAVSGSQVVGGVGADDNAVQGTNNSTNDVALSSAGVSLNTATGVLGPFADSTTTATATQNGDNDAVLDQDAPTETGDAVAGSQIFGEVA